MIDQAPTSQAERDRMRLAQLERAILRSAAAPRPARDRTVTGDVGHPDDAIDASLVSGAAAGQAHAFDELFRRHAGAVRTVIAYRVHDRQRREELVQDTFVRVFARLATLRDAGRFRPWVLQVARNLAIDEVRRCNRRRHLEIVSDDFAALPAAEDDEPATAYELRQLTESIAAGMSGLSERDGRVLAMSATSGLDIGEIATNLGITAGAAKVVLHRARRRLLARVRDAHEAAS